MKALPESEIRSLVSLLDEEDPANLDLVQSRILELGPAVIPYLDELRRRCEVELAGRVDEVARRLRLLRLREEFRELAAAPDLERGVWLVARFGCPAADPALSTGWLDACAEAVRRALPARATPAQTLEGLNRQLFGILGFRGNEKHYYDPDNSFLNRVIEKRRGIPVSLSVLYLLLSRRLSLPAFGVATPGHFLVGLRLGPQARYLDAYNRGRLMSLADVQEMLARSGYEFRPEFVAPASPRDILARMMRNLISIYQKAAQPERAEELSGLVDTLLSGRAPRPAARGY
jgi:regulator of sirC expression with transglutaminase-like and TPR domain